MHTEDGRYRTQQMKVIIVECPSKNGVSFNIDALGINEYNVGKISDYAKKMLDYGRYDEVEAEYMTLIKRNGGKLCQ